MTSDALDAAIAQVSEELRLDPAYRSSVRPLLRIPRERWPSCCGGDCAPCASTLVAVAERALEALGRAEPFEE
jgi:hypothetical protein